MHVPALRLCLVKRGHSAEPNRVVGQEIRRLEPETIFVRVHAREILVHVDPMPQVLAAVQVDHALPARGGVIQRHPIGRVLLRANDRGLEAKRRRHRADHRPPQIHMPTLDVPQLVGQHKPDKLPILIRVAHVHKVGVDDNISAGHLAFRRICIHDPIPIFDIQPGQTGNPLPGSVRAEAHLLGKVMVNGVDLGELGWGHLHRISDSAPIKPSDSEECERRGKNANQNPLAKLA